MKRFEFDTSNQNVCEFNILITHSFPVFRMNKETKTRSVNNKINLEIRL